MIWKGEIIGGVSEQNEHGSSTASGGIKINPHLILASLVTNQAC
jgi:hypothetical protein